MRDRRCPMGIAWVFVAVVLGHAASAVCGDGAPERYDILIRGGTIVDGSGAAGVPGDVGIAGGHIVAVGDLKKATATTVIDAAGRVVCPGFIDLHSHADRGIARYRAAENYIRQGVTTLVCGNCGSSPTDVAGFFEELRDGGTGPNVALLIGHGSVRQAVMGRADRAPTESELVAMRRLVREAMQAGAVGMSSGLRYAPGAYAETAEVIALAKEVAPFGGFYATHMRDEGTKILDALEEALEIGRRAGVPVHVSHHKISSVSVFGLTRTTLARIDAARAAGADVTMDQYPYGAGSGGMSLYVPQSSLAGGLEAFRRRIENPEQRAAIVAAVEELLVRKIYRVGQSLSDVEQTAIALARIQVARAPYDTTLEGQNVTEILQSRGKEVTLRNGSELLLELISHGASGINHTLEEDPGGDVDRVMQHPMTAIASDGGVFQFGTGNPHPRSYGCYPRVLAHYVRRRKVLSLEQAIHKMTLLPAQRLGWKDRGRIAEGQWADVVVFDPETIADKATFLAPHQYSVGIAEVIVGGRFVLQSGKMTGELPGRAVGLSD
jgi:N-acyl-D-amino-acid deacylase